MVSSVFVGYCFVSTFSRMLPKDTSFYYTLYTDNTVRIVGRKCYCYVNCAQYCCAHHIRHLTNLVLAIEIKDEILTKTHSIELVFLLSSTQTSLRLFEFSAYANVGFYKWEKPTAIEY